MIRVSPEEENLLFSDWKEGNVWFAVVLSLGEDGTEAHKFWAKIGKASEGKLVLIGLHAFVELPLEEGREVGYAEMTEVPLDLQAKFSRYEFCFTIRSQSVVAFLFGAGPKNEG